VRVHPALILVPLLIAGCGHTSRRPSDKEYQSLRSSFLVPGGFTPAVPGGPCQTDRHMQCWTTDALPTQAVHAAVEGLRGGYRTTDTSWCGPEHWAVQRKAWGEAHAPCTLRGTSHRLRVIVEAIAFPDRTASTPGHLVFPPTLVSITATAP
jgi:hypothetical protein